MQDMHAIGDGGGGGSGRGGKFVGVGDRRLRPHNHPNHQALKCPRCDSLNTKFCYYNNYNLSQPRYFCKSCRRYWTNGGILRNVPVGGGCRKAKRSKTKSSASNAGDAPRESKSNGQSSSSESSSLTAAVAEESSALTNTTPSSTSMFNFYDERFSNVNPQENSKLDHQLLVNHTSTDCEIFPTDIGSFTSLMTSPEEMMDFGMGDVPTMSYRQEQPVNHSPVADNQKAAAVDEHKIEDISNEELAAALDWGSGDGHRDHGLFDLTAGVDQAYWNQSEWTDNGQYLP